MRRKKIKMRERLEPKGKQDIRIISQEEIAALPGKRIEVDPFEVRGKSRTIKLEPNATMKDLFLAMHRIETKAPAQQRHSGSFWVRMWGKFSPEQVREIMRLEDRINRQRFKLPKEITEEDREAAALKVVDFFQSNGISVESIRDYLPIEFRTPKEERERG